MTSLSRTGRKAYTEMAEWISTNGEGTAEENEGMADLLLCLKKFCAEHQKEWKREQATIPPPESPVVQLPAHRPKTINWNRRLEEYKHRQIEEARLADEEEEERLVALEEENAIARQRASDFSRSHKEGTATTSWGASTVQKLESTWTVTER